MCAIRYKSGFKYQLAETYSCEVFVYPSKDISTEYITLTRFGVLTIKKGYAWDGPSGPTIDTKTFMRGALVHDALYQLMRMELLDASWRKQSDKELKKICLEDGMWILRAEYVYIGVRKGAGFAIDSSNVKKIHIAPK